MIDWLTLHLPEAIISDELRSMLMSWGHRVRRYDAVTGEIDWDTSAWESIRSDSHRLAARYDPRGLSIQGSPARCMGDGSNVFGSDNIIECAVAMLNLAGLAFGVELPGFRAWQVTRIDIAENYLLLSLADVRVLLSYLRGTEGGRYRVSQTAGDTVYWSSRSRLRSGKAYAKGPHIRYLIRSQPDAVEVNFTDSDLALLDRIIRLELRLGSQFLRERCPKLWFDLNSGDLRVLHGAFFEKMLSCRNEVNEMNPKDMIEATNFPTGQQQAAWRTWLAIQASSWQAVRDSMNTRTWYHHQKILRAAGLSDLDLSHGKIVPFRMSPKVLHSVRSWQELRVA